MRTSMEILNAIKYQVLCPDSDDSVNKIVTHARKIAPIPGDTSSVETISSHGRSTLLTWSLLIPGSDQPITFALGLICSLWRMLQLRSVTSSKVNRMCINMQCLTLRYYRSSISPFCQVQKNFRNRATQYIPFIRKKFSILPVQLPTSRRDGYSGSVRAESLIDTTRSCCYRSFLNAYFICMRLHSLNPHTRSGHEATSCNLKRVEVELELGASLFGMTTDGIASRAIRSSPPNLRSCLIHEAFKVVSRRDILCLLGILLPNGTTQRALYQARLPRLYQLWLQPVSICMLAHATTLADFGSEHLLIYCTGSFS